MTTNRSPVDRMADLKAEIAALQEEHDAIRESLISGDTSPIGEDWVASISSHSRTNISVVAARKVLSKEILDQISTVTELTQVRLVKAGR